MKPKPVRPEATKIQERFFASLNECISMGKIAGLQTFCKEYGLHKPKYSRLRTQIGDPAKVSKYKFIDIDSLYYLVKDFNISADWLLTGKGKMFR